MAAAGTRDRRTGGNTARKEGGKVLPFRHESTLNIGFIAFVFIFLYLVFSLVRAATRESYSSFTVGREESLNSSRSYHAVILRQENKVLSHWAGYVDFFTTEASHVSVGSVVSSVDELGTYSDMIRSASDLESLSTEEMLNLKAKLRSISASYSGDRFSSLYEGKDDVSTFFLSHVGSASLEVLEQNLSLNEFFHVHKSDTSGLVLFYQDGYETKQPKDLTAEDFTGKKYKRTKTEDLVTVGDFLYKLVDSEDWYLVLPLTAEEAAAYGEKTYVSFTFLKNGLAAEAPCSVVNGADGSYLLQLDMTRYLVQFAGERFTEIRIETSGESGYKVPLSCRVTETVYMIPREYEVSGTENGGAGFLQEIYNGTVRTARVIQPTVYYRDDEYCYISMEALPAETVLIKQDSQERYTVRLTTSITGVYQINAGFTVFCPIEVLDENGEYLLIKRGTANGITTYDTLLLNAAGYTAGQILR